jgi:hypothetical protein
MRKFLPGNFRNCPRNTRTDAKGEEDKEEDVHGIHGRTRKGRRGEEMALG